QMVLAMRLEADVLQEDDLVIAGNLLEGAVQQLHRVLAVAAEEFLIGADHPVRRAEQALALRVVARPADEGAHRVHRLLTRGANRGDRLGNVIHGLSLSGRPSGIPALSRSS